MSLAIVFRQRFRLFIGRVTGDPPQPFPGTTTLFEATKFDDTNIDIIFRRALNRDDQIGMGDVLKQPFAPKELKGATKIDEVLTAIGKRSFAGNVDAYRTLIEPRVMDILKTVLAGVQFPPGQAADVQPADPMARYVTPANVGHVTRKCNLRLDSGSRSPASDDDFDAAITAERPAPGTDSAMRAFAGRDGTPVRRHSRRRANRGPAEGTQGLVRAGARADGRPRP